MKTKIITKGGDYKDGAATTALWLGGKVSKSDPRIEVVGEIDELHGWMGTIHFFDQETLFGLKIDDYLYQIQKKLTWIMGEVSCIDGLKGEYRKKYPCISEVDLEDLNGVCENLLNFEMNHWHLHGQDGPKIAQIDLVCKVTRRVERHIAKLSALNYEIRDVILNYFNRLSDFFFILARCYAKFLQEKNT